VIDWVTVAELGTAGGTLVLAVATFGAVRSANRTARIAEASLLADLRPLLVPSRLTDPAEKFGFADGHWVKLEGGRGSAEVTDRAIYLGMSLRNVGRGLAVLHGWKLYPQRVLSDLARPDISDFHRLTRDIYVPAGDVGFWQGALRDPADPAFVEARDAIQSGAAFMVDVLYGDHQGGQRVISRFTMNPGEDGQLILAVSRHWNVDRPDPRQI
jgi:hypothetical protein